MDNFIAEHITEHTKDCSLVYIKNDCKKISVNENENRPLASIYKLIILLKYIEQCRKGKLSPNNQVHFSQLKRYWIHWIDSSFLKWYQTIKDENKIKKDCVSLKEVVNGMLAYSCNANTDYLLAILGVDAVNKYLSSFIEDSHDEIIPISTSVLVSIKDKKINHTPYSLGKLAQKYFKEMHKGIKIDGLDLNILNDFDYENQCLWSDLLPHASANIYIKVVKKIQELQEKSVELQELLSWFSNLKSYKRFTGGIKLGYTPKVFNVALHAIDSLGNKHQLVYFLNNLTLAQKQNIELSCNDFNLKMINNIHFVEQLKNELSYVKTR